MDFMTFAQAHGLLIRSLVVGKWVRVPTTDHAKKRNGAYKFMGDHGFVQNWANQTEPSLWRPETPGEIKFDPVAAAVAARRQQQSLEQDRKRAAEKAKWIIGQCSVGTHAYLARKGFPEERGLIWKKGDDEMLVIPMSVRDVVGCQIVSADGSKKFLHGQVTSMASFTMGQGDPILCEGYATGLSLRACLSAAKLRRSVIVCFSAGNLVKLAAEHPRAIVVADNDVSKAGEKAAISTGLPFWMSPQQGEDFNDYHQRVGLFKASQEIKRIAIRPRA